MRFDLEKETIKSSPSLHAALIVTQAIPGTGWHLIGGLRDSTGPFFEMGSPPWRKGHLLQPHSLLVICTWTMASTSIGTPMGRVLCPMALRADLPASPKISIITSVYLPHTCTCQRNTYLCQDVVSWEIRTRVSAFKARFVTFRKWQLDACVMERRKCICWTM